MTEISRLAAFTLAVLPLIPASGADLAAEIDLLIRTKDLGGATVSVSVRDASTGARLVDLQGDRPMIPASNMKLLTTGAAIHVLGPDFHFRTRLLRSGERLIVVGDGDPGFADPELLQLMTTERGALIDSVTILQWWVDAVVRAGIRHVDELVVDDRIFDREFVHPSWPSDQLNRPYCAQVAGLAFHLNRLDFYPEPRAGQPWVRTFSPKVDWLQIENRATSRSGADDRDTLWIARKLNENALTFYGNAKHAYRTPVSVTVHDMPAFFARLMSDHLEQAGVDVRQYRVADASDPASTGAVLGPVMQTSIETALTRCNRDSENLYAEALLKRIGYELTGQPGSWLNGGSILRLVAFERLSDPAMNSSLTISDGSGLSRENRVAPSTLTAWLSSLHNDDRMAPAFLASLAVGGESGTLERRLSTSALDGATVRGKTGYIRGVSCLSGFVTLPEGGSRCFSVMINDLRSPLQSAKDLQDRIVEAVAADMIGTSRALGSD